LPAEIREDLVLQKVANETSVPVGVLPLGGNPLAGHFDLEETAIGKSVDASGPNDSVDARPKSSSTVHGAWLSGGIEIELVPEVVSKSGSLDTHGSQLGGAVSESLILSVKSGVSRGSALSAVGAEQSVVGSVDDDGTKGSEGATGVLGASLNLQGASHPVGARLVGDIIGKIGSSGVGEGSELVSFTLEGSGTRGDGDQNKSANNKL
jgi:hypothetical protein